MNIKVLSTKGWGNEAEIEFCDFRFIVMDGFSRPGEARRVRSVENASVTCFQIAAQNWDTFFTGNPERRKVLQAVKGWDYVGYGQVESINPMIIDFGILSLEGGFPTHDPKCVGQFVQGNIQRLTVSGDPNYD